MQMYFAPSSPFVRKVTVLLHELGRTDEVELISVYGTPLDPGNMPVDRNPLGKLPTLVADDGRTIFDSRVICRYLDELFDGGFYPMSPDLWDVLIIEATADGILESALQMVYEKRLRAEEQQSPDLIEGYWAKVERAFALVDEKWIGYLNGPVDMAHIAIGAALGYLDFRHPDRDWRSGNPKLAEWYKTFSARESMRATEPRNPT